MKKVNFLFVLSLLVFTGCEKMCEYRFKMTNATQEKITLVGQYNEVDLLPNQESIIFVGYDFMGIEAHDILTDDQILNHGLWNEIIFETIINDEKLEIELWRSNNWTFKKHSKWLAEYSMTVTYELIEQNKED